MMKKHHCTVIVSQLTSISPHHAFDGVEKVLTKYSRKSAIRTDYFVNKSKLPTYSWSELLLLVHTDSVFSVITGPEVLHCQGGGTDLRSITVQYLVFSFTFTIKFQKAEINLCLCI